MLTDNLIHLVNDLQDALGSVRQQVDLNLPQIAVVGSQSSGKTSVLESLVGRDFLPRGSGIVTRCPLVLKLVQVRPKEGETVRDYGVFAHKPGVMIDNFDEIRQEIERQTVVLAGPKGVVPTPISLTVYSPNVISLTVVDLPGVVQTAIQGQDQGIVQAIETMVMNFIKPDNTIILAITPANSDLANSTAINMARRVDPDFDRTIGVLTKLDIMDRGTNALDVLEGRMLPLKRGWIGVVNRSQEDTNNRLPLAEARKREMDFFRTHPTYKNIADRQGTAHLAHMMSGLLLRNIQATLPDVIARVDDFYQRAMERQELLGAPIDESNREGTLMKLLNAYVDAVNRTLDGNPAAINSESTPRQPGELVGGARIDYMFHGHFIPFIRGLLAKPELSDDKIRETTANCNGMQPSLFGSDRAFYQLTREQIKRLDGPTQQCAKHAHQELERLTVASSQRLFERFPVLKEHVQTIQHALLQDALAATQAHIRTMLESERSYINVRHPIVQEALRTRTAPAVPTADPTPAVARAAAPPAAPAAVNGTPAAAAKPVDAAPQRASFDVPATLRVSGPLSDPERKQFDELRHMIEAYFGVTKETVCDQVPKVVTHVLVGKTQRETHGRLMSQLYRPEMLSKLLEEAPQIATQRKNVTELLVALRRAREILNRVRDVPTDQV